MNKKLLVVILSMTLIITLVGNVSPCFAKLNKPTPIASNDAPNSTFPSELCVEKKAEGFVCSLPEPKPQDDSNVYENPKEKREFEELNQSIF